MIYLACAFGDILLAHCPLLDRWLRIPIFSGDSAYRHVQEEALLPKQQQGDVPRHGAARTTCCATVTANSSALSGTPYSGAPSPSDLSLTRVGREERKTKQVSLFAKL